MPAQKQSETEVTQTPEDAAGVEGAQAKPTEDKSAKEVKADLAYAPDRDLHPAGEPNDPASKDSYPGPAAVDPENPPLRTARPDVPILRTLATGAGAHNPPDPKEFHPDGRPRHQGNP